MCAVLTRPSNHAWSSTVRAWLSTTVTPVMLLCSTTPDRHRRLDTTVRRRRGANVGRFDEHRNAGKLDGRRRSLGILHHVRAARWVPGLVRVAHGRTRKKSGGRSAREYRHRDPGRRSRSACQRRITLAGRVERPTGDEFAAAREAHLAGVPAAKYYVDFSDFSLWVLRVERVRWVGGYGRMDSATADAYNAAAPDPVTPVAAGAISHLNDDHADSLVAMAQRLGGFPDTTEAACTGADRYGLDLRVTTPRESPTPGSDMPHRSMRSTNCGRQRSNWRAEPGPDLTCRRQLVSGRGPASRADEHLRHPCPG